MPTLLLELFSEEIPSRMQKGAAEQLERPHHRRLRESRPEATARSGLMSARATSPSPWPSCPTRSPTSARRKKARASTRPAQALDGFFKGAGIPQENAEVREIGGARYFFAVIHRKGRPTAEVAQDICEAALAAFTWPKSMRWGAHELQWVRPLHRIACLLDRHTVPVRFGHLTAGSVTEGHRFLSPGAIALHAAADYEGQAQGRPRAGRSRQAPRFDQERSRPPRRAAFLKRHRRRRAAR
ncbi:MAG: glycine--tRNA ligase subunit beta [Alphaproteobacteria bacterium]